MPGEFERIGDHAVNLTENAQEFLDRSASLSPTAHQELMVLREVLGEILDYTYKAFAATDYEAARHIEPVEEVVDDLVATLRANHIRRVRDGQCTVYAGLTFLDILVNVERIADQCSNVGVFTLSMFDEHIMNNHHDYIQALHRAKTRSSTAPIRRRTTSISASSSASSAVSELRQICAPLI